MSKSAVYLKHIIDEVEFIIVDNGSTDNTRDILNRLKPFVNMRTIFNEGNMGFTIACNQGADVAGGNHLLFLNNDIIVKGDYISLMVDTLAKKDKVIVGAELYEHDTGWNVFGDNLVRYIPGWCLGISRENFSDLGGFDNRYTPFDYEDMDLCYGAVQRGYELLRLPLPLDHLSGRTGLQIGIEDRAKVTRTNRLKFAEKWGL